MNDPVISARAEVPGTLISDYLYRPVAQPRELIVLLHGYSLSGRFMFDRLQETCPSDAAILAPNAPFPIPERTPDGYKAGFSWYFYDPATDDYVIDMRVALELLDGMVAQLGLSELPKRLIGFSQGGYLAPFAALRLGKVSQVIGVAAEYLPEELDMALKAQKLQWPLRFRVDAVHGEKDGVVSPAHSKKAHTELLARGAEGQWVGLPAEGHRLNRSVVAAVARLLASAV